MPGRTGFVLLAVVAFVLNGCGGGGASTPAPSPSTTPATSGTGSPATVPVVVTVGSQPVTGIDINVSSPASTTPPNAQDIGVAIPGTQASAANTGTTISRSGGLMTVILFGPGLNGSMTVTIGGPQDITVSNIRSITSKGGTAGIAFDALVSPAAALGARSVILRAANDDITTFTGGLEVIP